MLLFPSDCININRAQAITSIVSLTILAAKWTVEGIGCDRICEGALHCVRLCSSCQHYKRAVFIFIQSLEHSNKKHCSFQKSPAQCRCKNQKNEKAFNPFTSLHTPPKTREGARNASCQKDLRGEERGRGGRGILFWGKPCLQSLTQTDGREKITRTC